MISIWKRPSQALREWILFGVFAIGMAGMIGYSLYRDYWHIHDSESARLSTHAKVIHDIISQHLEAISETLATIRDRLPPDGWQQEDATPLGKKWLNALVAAMPSLHTLAILDASGRVAISNQEGMVGKKLGERDFFQMILKNPNPDLLYIGPPVQTDTGAWTLNLSRAVTGTNGELLLVITASTCPAVFRTVLNSVNYTPDAWSSIAHGDGWIFMIEPHIDSLPGKNVAVPGSFFTRHMLSGQEATVMTGTVYATGEPRMVALRHLQPRRLAMDKPLLMVTSRHLKTLFAHWSIDLLTRFGLYVVLLLVAAPCLYVLQRRRQLAQRMADQLWQARMELKSFFEISPDLLCITDLHGNFRKLNPSWTKVLGYPIAEIQGAAVMTRVHPEDAKATLAVMSEVANGKDVLGFINRYRHQNGSYRYIEWYCLRHGDFVFSTARDVTERRQSELHLQHMAYHDRLTGLANRTLLLDRLSQALSSAKRKKRHVAVLFIDLDGFKNVNDAYGHEAGDTVLKTVAIRFQSVVRSTDSVARMGGDEFVVVLNDLNHPSQAGQVANKLLATLYPEISLEKGFACRISASIGISLYPDHGTEINGLLIAADSAMYQAKKGGKNRCVYTGALPREADRFDAQSIVLFDPPMTGITEMDQQHRELMVIVNQICEAVVHNADVATVEGLFEALTESAAVHFSTEHQIMRRHAYPGLSSHQMAHEYLLAEIPTLRPQIFKEGSRFMIKLTTDWMMAHILKEDLLLAQFLKQHPPADQCH